MRDDANPIGAADFQDTVLNLTHLTSADLSARPSHWITRIVTPLGPMISVTNQSHLVLLEFLERQRLPKEMAALRRNRVCLGFGDTNLATQTQAALDAYFASHDLSLDVPIAPLGSPFQQSVWAALKNIPAGDTVSYGTFAHNLGRPSATRAVAAANAANPIAIIIPCHRLVAANGALTGYGGGLWRKKHLLTHERSLPHDK